MKCTFGRLNKCAVAPNKSCRGNRNVMGAGTFEMSTSWCARTTLVNSSELQYVLNVLEAFRSGSGPQLFYSQGLFVFIYVLFINIYCGVWGLGSLFWQILWCLFAICSCSWSWMQMNLHSLGLCFIFIFTSFSFFLSSKQVMCEVSDQYKNKAYILTKPTVRSFVME